MLVTRELVERLEEVEAEVCVRLAHALRTTTGDPAVEVLRRGRGALVATGAGRYVNRGIGTTLVELRPDEVDEVVRWFTERGQTPAVQLSSWAPPETVASFGCRGFVPTSSRSVLVRDAGAPTAGTAPEVEVVVVDEDTAADAREVMASGSDERQVSDEFMAADLVTEGTVQLLARIDGRPVGCGSVTVVGATAWLGAARTVADARRRGVQAALIARRLELARECGCDLVGVTATTGSDSARNLGRLGFHLVQDQWVVEQVGG